MTYEEVIYSVQKFKTSHETEGLPVGHRKHLWEPQLTAITTNSSLWKQPQVRKVPKRASLQFHHCTVIYLPVPVKYMLTPGDPVSVY